MSDKPEDIEDDILDDDLGLDDFDEDDALDDESWDDFDDELAPEESDNIAAASAAHAQSAKKKGFFSKHFNAIVITVAVIGGGGWFLTQMGAPAPDQQKTTAFETVNDDAASTVEDVQPMAELSDDSDTLPMPAPINSVAENAAGEADDILTPMPDFSTAPTAPTQETSELTDAEIFGDITEESDAPAFDLSELPDDLTILPEDNPAPILDAPTEEFTLTEVKNPPAPAVPTEGVDIDILLEAPKEEASAPVIQTLIEERAPSMEQAAPTLPAVDLEKFENRFSEIESANADLFNQMDKTNDKIDKLVESFASIEGKLDVLSAKQAAAPKETQQKAPPPSRPKAKPVASETTVTSPAKTTPPKTSVKTAQRVMTWKLRSAQPGKATLFSENTRDVRSVEVGQTIEGLGRITSIAQENGLWVVRGTQKSVSQ